MNGYVTQVIRLGNGNCFGYVNYMNSGTWFKYGEDIRGEGWKYKENEKLWKVLSSLVHSGRRVRVWYGDTETGRSWNEEYGVTGTIGRSAGKIAVPILIGNSRSCCSGALLDDCIIRIDDIKAKRTVYRQDNFHVEKLEVVIESGSDCPYRVMQHKDSGEVQAVAGFKDGDAALRWIGFMYGDRYRK